MSRPVPFKCFYELPVAMKRLVHASQRRPSLSEQLILFQMLRPSTLQHDKLTICGRLLSAKVLAFSDAYRETVRDLLCLSSQALLPSRVEYSFTVPPVMAAFAVQPREYIATRFLSQEGYPLLPIMRDARVLFDDACALFPALVKLASVAFECRAHHLPLMRKPLDDIIGVLFTLDVLAFSPPTGDGVYGICRDESGQLVYRMTLEQELSNISFCPASEGKPGKSSPLPPQSTGSDCLDMVFFSVLEPLSITDDAARGDPLDLPDNLCDLMTFIDTYKEEEELPKGRDWIVIFPLRHRTILAESGDFVCKVRCVRWRLFGSHVLMHLSRATNDTEDLPWPAGSRVWPVSERLAYSAYILNCFS